MKENASRWGGREERYIEQRGESGKRGGEGWEHERVQGEERERVKREDMMRTKQERRRLVEKGAA